MEEANKENVVEKQDDSSNKEIVHKTVKNMFHPYRRLATDHPTVVARKEAAAERVRTFIKEMKMLGVKKKVAIISLVKD